MKTTWLRWSVMTFGVAVLGGPALAQNGYIGDDTCKICHQDLYDSYMQSGHPWMLVPTNRQQPAADLYPHGVPLPELPQGVTWDQVDYIFGNFSSGHGYVVGTNAEGTQGIVLNRGFPYNFCVRCHTTGYDPTGGPTNGITGSWVQNGIRCEGCHGPGEQHATSFGGNPPDLNEARAVCANCHYAGTDVERIDFTPPEPDQEGFGSFGHHPQAEQLLRSPHKNGDCSWCHDPHKSTFFPEEGGVIKHCTDCHDAKQHPLPPAMAHVDCVECHMTEGGGHRHIHLFQIMTQPIAAADNVYVDETDQKTYWNVDANGNAFLTLDLVCLTCHNGQEAFAMTLEEAAAEAQGIHVPTVLTVDIKVNGQDDFLLVQQDQQVSVDASVAPGASQNVPATWWILASTNFGWFYWDPIFDGWLPGLYPSLVDFGVFEVQDYNLYNDTLPPGTYSFWLAVFANDGAMDVDVVPVYVLP
ncbi:MAG: hypothetical protein GXP27_20350 [Planctomycetes bacterium]|nr:hypothetical protein [Planctomycetota bacterium]